MRPRLLPFARISLVLIALCTFFEARPSQAATPVCATVVSGFWDRLEALCAQSRLMQPPPMADAGAPTTTPVDPVADPEFKAYCDAQTPPAFAALSEDARMKRLAEIARRMTFDEQRLPAVQHALESRAAASLADLIVATKAGQVLDNPAGMLLISQFTGAACALSGAVQWLPSTCTPGKTPNDYPSLVRALANDVAQLPARLFAASGKMDSPSVGAIKILLQMMMESPDPFALARALAESASTSAANQGCALYDATVAGALPSDNRDAVRVVVAGQLLRRLLEDGPDLSRADAHYIRALEQVLHDDGRLAVGTALSTVQRNSATMLVQDVRDLRLARAALENATTGELRQAAFIKLATAMVNAVQHDLSLVDDRDEQLPGGVLLVASALTQGDLPGALTSATGLAGEHPPIDPSALKAATVGVRLVVAHSEDEAKRVLREIILPPWLGGLILDASAGVPIVGLDELNLDFGGTVGWESDRWGAWGHASRSVYDTQLNNRDWTEAKANLSGSAWLNFGKLDQSGWFVGADLALDQLSSDLTIFRTGTVSEEISQIVRGNLAVGFWANLSPTAVLRLRAEGGFHQEYYSQDVAASMADGGVSSKDEQSLAGDYRGQALLAWRVVPGYLRVAVQGRGSYFQLTRSSSLFTYNDMLSFSQQNVTTSTSRLGAGLRTGFEIEALSIGNLVRPGAFVDVAYTRTDDGQAPISQTVVTTGLGLRSYLPE
jgi:hypothetical protein